MSLDTRCGDCRNYEPARNPETNRPRPSYAGSCTYPVTWPKLPKSFAPIQWGHFGRSLSIEFPKRGLVWKDNKEPCEMFEARTTADKRRVVQMTLAMPDVGVIK